MDISARSAITNVNPRGQLRGPEERDLAVDVNFKFTTSIDEMPGLFDGIVRNIKDFKKAMWTSDDIPVALWPDLPLSFMGRYKDQQVTLLSAFAEKGSNEVLFKTDTATLCKFKGMMKNAHEIEISCQMQMVCNGQIVGVLCELMIDGDVHLKTTDKQQDLDFDED